MSTEIPLGVDARRVQRRTLSVLMVSQALGGAGLAQTSQVLGAAVVAFLLARVTAARGRRAGLALGYGIGAIGAVLCILAGLMGSFPLLLVGTLGIGSATAANNQARYAATDLAEPDHRARALSLVVWTTTIGSVMGPNLAGPGATLAHRIGTPELTGPFVFSALATGLAALWLALRLRPDPLLVARELAHARGESHHAHVTLRHISAVVRVRPRALAAMVAMAVAHAVMVSVMVMTPLHIHHGGGDLKIIGLVLSAHVLGMYAFAPLVGWLVDRIGHAAVLAAGAALLLTAVALAGGAPAGGSHPIVDNALRQVNLPPIDGFCSQRSLLAPGDAVSGWGLKGDRSPTSQMCPKGSTNPPWRWGPQGIA